MKEILEKLEELKASTTMYADDEYAAGWLDALNACISIVKSQLNS